MPMGIKCGPSIFQRCMTEVLDRCLPELASCFLDDILLYNRNWESFIKTHKVIFARLRKHGLAVKASKCFFGFSELKCLGFIVGRNGIKIDPDKIDAVARFPVPKNKTQLRAFVGLCSYLRRLIPDFAQIAEPLTSMTSGADPGIKWNEKADAAFKRLKEIISTEPVVQTLHRIL